MPKIRDWSFGYQATATATTVTAPLPLYAQNDLLLAIISTDTGTQTYTSSGWTQLFSTTNTCNLGIMWKIAGASETTPTFTYSVSETANLHIVAIQDVNTTTPFNGTGGAGTGYRTATNTLARAAMPILTTTVANSLLIYVNVESGAVVPAVLEGACTFEDGADGSAHSDGISWGFKQAIGASPTVYSNKSGTAAGILATIGISPPSGGATVIPAYCASDLSIYVDPIHGTTAYNGNTAFAATATANFGTTINGRTLSNGSVSAALDVGLNSFHSMGQLTGVTTDGTYAGSALVLATANKPNVTGKNILVHCKPSTPKSYQNLDAITKSTAKGIVIAMASTAATAFKAFHVHGAGTAWNSSAHIPLVINNTATLGAIQTTGTLNPASIASFGFFVSGFTAAPVFQFGSLWVLDTTTIAGGTLAEPVGVNGIWKICSAGKERMSVLQQGSGQALILQPIQFGDGGTNSLKLDLGETAIEFPQQYNVTSKNVFYCSADNVAGITYYAGTGDSIVHNNAVVSSKSKYHWRIHASSSASATYDFSGLSIIGAGDIQLRDVTTFNNMNFTSCPTIYQNNATISNSILTTSYIISNALNKISGCKFISGGTGHAIEITVAGTYSFSGNTFTGYGAGSTTNACIYNNSGGAVTINVNGGDTPTIRNGVSASTTVNNLINLTLTGLITGSDVVILQAGTSVQLQDTQDIIGTSHTYGYSTQQNVDIGVFKEGYVPFYIRNYSLGATNASLPIAQVADRNFI